MEPDAAAAAALIPTTPATPIPAAPTVTLAAAAEVQRLDVAVMHEKALGILAALKQQAAIVEIKTGGGLGKWLYLLLLVLPKSLIDASAFLVPNDNCD